MNSMTLGMPINTGSLVDQVIDRITNAMIHKELKPGDQLPTETELSSTLNVGKSSVREAIKVLQAMGVVEVRRGEGTFIATKASGKALNPILYQLLIEPGTLKEIIELRVMFEPAYTQLAMKNAQEEDMQRILAARERFETIIKKSSPTGEDDIEFHRAILQATHNSYIIRIGEVMLKIFMESVGHSVRQVPQHAVEDHRRICEAFVARDAVALGIAVTASFESWISHQENEGGEE